MIAAAATNAGAAPDAAAAGEGETSLALTFPLDTEPRRALTYQ